MDHVGKTVRRLREVRGLNQAQLAVSVGTGPSAISQIENGKRSPNSETLVKLARALEVEVADLFPKGQASLWLGDEQRHSADAGDVAVSTEKSQTQLKIEEAQRAIEALLKQSGVSVRYLTMPREELEALYEAATLKEAKAITAAFVDEKKTLANLHPDARFPGFPTRAIFQNLGVVYAGMKWATEREAGAVQESGEEDRAERIREEASRVLRELDKFKAA